MQRFLIPRLVLGTGVVLQLLGACTDDQHGEPESSSGGAVATGGRPSDGGTPAGDSPGGDSSGAVGTAGAAGTADDSGGRDGGGGESPGGGTQTGGANEAGEGPSAAGGQATTGGRATAGGRATTGGLTSFDDCAMIPADGIAAAGAGPVTDDTRCDCDRWGASCYTEPGFFCYGPSDVGCDPTLDRVRRSPGLLCAHWVHYSECESTVRLRASDAVLDDLEYTFDRATGLLIEAKAYPVLPDCGSAPWGETGVTVTVTGPGDIPRSEHCTSCEFSQEAEADGVPCVIVDGQIALPDTSEAGAGGAPATPASAASSTAGRSSARW